MKKIRFMLLPLLGVLPLFTLISCADIDYYVQATRGQLQILNERKPIPTLLASEEISPRLRQKLSTALTLRDFASRELLLPENGSYRSYSDIKRPHVVWNVVATPEFSLEPVRWCFPVAGCVSYRGFFSEEDAGTFADGLRSKGYDVYLYGVSAYSTLGWFDDPILNTFVERRETDLAGLIFHELAHQKLYVKNDSSFNESFAKTVELEGVARYLARYGGEDALRAYREEKVREEQWVQLVAGAQQRLRDLFASVAEPQSLRTGKDSVYEWLRQEYARLKELWGGYSGYDRWFGELNNAKLASVDTYRSYVPAFQRLLQNHDGDLHAFYREAKSLGRLSAAERLARLEALREEYVASHRPTSSDQSGQSGASEKAADSAATEGG